MQKRWFVHDGEDVEFYDSESAARASALDAVERWRAIGLSEGEWPEEVEHVMWGSIEQGVVARGDDYVLVDVR